MQTTERRGPQSRLTFEEQDRRQAPTVYEQLAAAILPQMEAYQADLTTHDRRQIEDRPALPFLHWARSSGTTLWHMPDVDNLPKRGERVPYLFGTADREHIVKSAVDVAKHEAKEPRFAVHYFDGQRLRRIDQQKALDIAQDYQRRMLRLFREQEQPTTCPDCHRPYTYDQARGRFCPRCD